MPTVDELEFWIRSVSFTPIAICSVIGLGVTIWKWRQLRQPNLPASGLTRIHQLIRDGDLPQALALTRGDGARTSRLITELLQRAGHATARLTERANQTGVRLARELEYGLGTLTLIATLGPLFGLLGTVVGITLVFERMASTGGLATTQQLAGGIGTALHTTIAGLVVGILALVSHRYLAAQVDERVGQLESVGAEVVDLLSGDTR